MDKKKALENLLINEFKDVHHVKSFVKEWREFEVDVGDVRVIDKLLENNEVLLSMISLYNFGITKKILNIKTTTKV